MHTVAIVAAVAVGAVFLVSAVTKLANPQQWRQQALDLGVAVPIITALPLLEALLGAVLIVQWQRRGAAAVALGLLIAFTVLLVVRLRQGRRPPCACFGSFSVRPIGWGHVARNAAFAALALLALAVP